MRDNSKVYIDLSAVILVTMLHMGIHGTSGILYLLSCSLLGIWLLGSGYLTSPPQLPALLGRLISRWVMGAFELAFSGRRLSLLSGY